MINKLGSTVAFSGSVDYAQKRQIATDIHSLQDKEARETAINNLNSISKNLKLSTPDTDDYRISFTVADDSVFLGVDKVYDAGDCGCVPEEKVCRITSTLKPLTEPVNKCLENIFAEANNKINEYLKKDSSRMSNENEIQQIFNRLV